MNLCIRDTLMRWGIASSLALGAAGAALAAAPVVTTISGNPLTIHIGDDHSFQVFHDSFPGTGQFYPDDATGTADMGWIVHADGTQYAPDFDDHSSSTATGNLGSYTPYAAPGRTVSAVSGSGTSASPYEVTITAALGASGLTSTEVVRYVNGENFFRKSFTLTNNGDVSQSVNIFLGGDIYLADSDDGIPYRTGNSVGGSNCPVAPATLPNYHVLYIAQTPADRWSGNSYGNIWTQIGNGTLDNALATGCIDNGAALQWNRTLAAGASVTIDAATSFGDIPPIAGGGGEVTAVPTVDLAGLGLLALLLGGAGVWGVRRRS